MVWVKKIMAQSLLCPNHKSRIGIKVNNDVILFKKQEFFYLESETNDYYFQYLQQTDFNYSEKHLFGYITG